MKKSLGLGTETHTFTSKEGWHSCQTISYKSQLLSPDQCFQKSFRGTKMPSSGRTD